MNFVLLKRTFQCFLAYGMVTIGVVGYLWCLRYAFWAAGLPWFEYL